MLEGRGVSGHPADLLIRELIQTGRAAAAGEVEQIIERMATAPFSTRQVSVPSQDRHLVLQGVVVGERAPSLDYHVAKRVADGQWRDGTTTAEFQSDLQRAVRDWAARLLVFERRGGPIAAVIAPTQRVLPPERLGAKPEPNLLVIYTPYWGTILSGYMFSTRAQTGIPGVARWLR